MLALQLLLVVGALGADGNTVLLNFTRASCPPCRAMEPVLAQLEAAGMPIQTINVEQHPEIARRFNLEGTPTFVMLVEGRETSRVVGSTSIERLRAMFAAIEMPLSDDAGSTIRGQSPAETSENYVGNRLGALTGKGSGQAKSTSPPVGDPFSHQQEREDDSEKTVAAVRGEDPQARAMAAAVRLKVEDAKGHSIGSGTIVDTHGSEAVLLTCGHIFRVSEGKGRISVDLFYPKQCTVEGKLLGYDLKRDIAIVSITPGASIVSAPVAPEGLRINKSDAAFSIGCDKGHDPSIRQSQITGLNRYQGPPNIEAAGEPVDGRSGGGLFSKEGYLIGVCNAADPADQEGIYAGMGTIHWQLERAGLAELYLAKPTTDAIAEISPNEPSLPLPPPLKPVPELGPLAGSVPDTLASNSDMEVICIVRSKSNPALKGQMFLINQARPELLQQLAASSSNPAVAADMALADRRNEPSTAMRGSDTVLRGQSRR